MDYNNERSQPQSGDSGDWRAELLPESRQRIANKIMETLKRHLPFSGEDGLVELKRIAVRFEEKIYNVATSQADYLRKISLKMLTMEAEHQNPIPNNPNGSRPAQPEPAIDSGDWRTQLQPESRQRIANKIMETLSRHLPFSGEDGLRELKTIAVRFEEKIYNVATSQADYLRKISMKMLTMETKNQNPIPNNRNGSGPVQPGE